MNQNDKKKPTFPKISKDSWPAWLNRRTLILLIIALMFLGALSLAEPLPRPNKYSYAGLTHTPTAVVLEDGAPTPLPAEYLENINQTTGILLGGTILVLIVVFGTLSGLRQKH